MRKDLEESKDENVSKMSEQRLRDSGGEMTRDKIKDENRTAKENIKEGESEREGEGEGGRYCIYSR